MESALVNLRAELYRKKEEACKLPTDQFKPKRKVKPIIKESKNIRKPQSNKSQKREEYDNEVTLKFEKSRISLEKKAALYDKIKGGVEVLEDDELNDKFLIDFQEKIRKEVSTAKKEREEQKDKDSFDSKNLASYKAKDSSEEWVEYTDSFGRTRVCRQKDVDYLKKQDENMQQTNPKPESKVHVKWDKVEGETINKKSVHYQDVLFDEARNHGTSYMAFSRDEQERAAQQQLLRDFSEETTKATLSKESLRRKRQKMMEERLAKVRQRKRLKMGLPVKDDDKLKTPPPSDEEDDTTDVKDEPETSPKKEETEKKSTHIREWDVGKPGVSSTMSQEQWIESRRKKRDTEFAPPVNYQKEKEESFSSKWDTQDHRKGSFDKWDQRDSREEEVSDEEEERRGKSYSEFAPPSSYDYYRSSATKRNFSLGRKINVEAAISKGISELRKKFDGGSE